MKILYAGSLFIVLLMGQGCCNPPKVGSITVGLRPQETDNWCWAANAEMVHRFFNHAITQCALANSRLGRSDCCQAEENDGCPKNDDCNQSGNTRAAIESLNYTVTQADTPLSWAGLKEAIHCGKKPLVFSDGAAGGGVGHVRVIYGYAEVGDNKYIFLMDPWVPCVGSDESITYETYTNTTGPGRVHRRTLYQFVDNN